MSAFCPYTFHALLRKALDSVASSICWNVINVIDGERWARFCRAVNKSKAETLRERCLEAAAWGHSDENLLRLGLEMLTGNEWAVLEKCMLPEE